MNKFELNEDVQCVTIELDPDHGFSEIEFKGDPGWSDIGLVLVFLGYVFYLIWDSYRFEREVMK